MAVSGMATNTFGNTYNISATETAQSKAETYVDNNIVKYTLIVKSKAKPIIKLRNTSNYDELVYDFGSVDIDGDWENVYEDVYRGILTMDFSVLSDTINIPVPTTDFGVNTSVYITIEGEEYWTNVLRIENTKKTGSITKPDDNSVLTISGLRDLLFPIGAIYFSLNYINPESIIGGKWERIERVIPFFSHTSYSPLDNWYVTWNTTKNGWLLYNVIAWRRTA